MWLHLQKFVHNNSNSDDCLVKHYLKSKYTTDDLQLCGINSFGSKLVKENGYIYIFTQCKYTSDECFLGFIAWKRSVQEKAYEPRNLSHHFCLILPPFFSKCFYFLLFHASCQQEIMLYKESLEQNTTCGLGKLFYQAAIVAQ